MSISAVKGKSLKAWKSEYPILEDVIATNEVFWENPNYVSYEKAERNFVLTKEDVKDAEERLLRFAPYIAKVFPETKEMSGIIESPLVETTLMKKHLENTFEQEMPGTFLLKCDNELPISGSIKARGGIYEVLQHAEKLAMEHDLLGEKDDYAKLDSDTFREFFSQYSIAVGSTGNLGLSIGIMSAKLGFQVTVHMSADAKEWKKELLRSKGVTVVEYASDYSKAVEEGRKQAEQDTSCYFIDDENSKHLFWGYAVAASRVKKQLEDMNIQVDAERPLFVYLPCGVGGGPGGVAFGLKLLFGDHVHCFFAEPTHSPCMLLGLVTGLHDEVSVQDFGIDNVTEADGLAVGRASGFVGKTIEPLLSGCYTVQDEKLYTLLKAFVDTENKALEPSALAGVYGPVQLYKQKQYIQRNNLSEKMKHAVHMMWATGGGMVPKQVMEQYYQKGK
ncbi:D-serine ammonia-lyase [Bacillus gaemokensis]|uniref:Probable D-serine dehydratase n=1 Tax=Bacillus gaemokensis TaxID=574375 RepID=A0A073K8W3_9BACI|nr:D-serine ammonia-lyase [Bacillus gaemokensis]KEK22892.1 serine ammonia-lyase [Bacillus gaemokensis]KYG34692.1 D-serine dehydratase [Bacillus gaemokensis]